MALTTIPAAGAKLRGSVLSALITEVRPVAGRVTTATTVNNSTTLVNAAGLSAAVVANAVYYFDLDLQYTTNITADIKIGWTFPTGTTMDWGGMGYNTGEAFTGFGGLIQTTVPGLGGTGSGAKLFGWIVTSSTAGTMQVQFAQNSLAVVNTSIDVGSTLELRRIE